jgi:dGTPase
MRLNEDLVEAISLAHDLGHTPFGHAGQDALNKCMKKFGGFEHNLQSLRVVDQLEKCYASFPGLNLTFETREGILKHCSLTNARKLGELGKRFVERQQPGLEAQLSNVADEIAYNNHDVDDGLRSGLIKLRDLTDISFFTQQLNAVKRLYPGIDERQRIHEVVRAMIGELVADLINTSQHRIENFAPDSIDAIRDHNKPLISFSNAFLETQKTLKQFLREQLYRHPKVHSMTEKAHEIISVLFETFQSDYECMPPEHAQRAQQACDKSGTAAAARVVSDYIAGMTDRFALQAHEALGKNITTGS